MRVPPCVPSCLFAVALAIGAAGTVLAGPVQANGQGQGQGSGTPPSQAAPVPTYCSATGATNAAGMHLSDVTFSGNTPTSHADDCFGLVGGNDANTDLNALIGAEWGTGWGFLAKDDGALTGGVFGGLTFSLDVVSPGATTGTWTLTASPAERPPVYLDFIAVLKAGDEMALWYFDDVKVGASAGGDWTSVFTNTNDQLKNLSHMSLYVRQGDVPKVPPEIPPPGTVPEPSALALVGLGLAGTALARRRRRQR